MFIKTLCNLMNQSLTSLAFGLKKTSDANVDIQALTWEYKSKAEAEISRHMLHLASHKASLASMEAKLKDNQKTLQSLIKSIKAGDVSLKPKAASLLRLIDARETARDNLQESIEEYKVQISDAMLEKDMVLTELEIVTMQNNLADMQGMAMGEIKLAGGRSVKDIAELVNDKTLFIKAKKEVQAEFKPVEVKDNSEWMERLEKML